MTDKIDERIYNLILSSKTHLETLFDSISDPIIVVSRDKTIERMNSATSLFIDMDYREAIGKKCHAVFHGSSTICTNCPHPKVLREKEKGSFKIDVTVNGNTKIFDLRYFPLYDKTGAVTAMVEHYVDISEGEAAKIGLEREHDRILQELKIARSIQEALLPTELPNIHGVKIEVEYSPIEEVGGDLYDFISIDKEHIGFLIADVSGHGVPASLMCAMAKMSFYNHTSANLSTLDVFEKVNRDLFHNLMMEYYISGVYLIYNTIKNTLRYSRAGHPEPLLWRKSTGKVEKLHTPGYFLGIMSNGDYRESEVSVNKGDRLLLYTDGVIEAMNESSEKFGMERLISWLKSAAVIELSTMKEDLCKEIQKFVGKHPMSDDLTFLCIEFTEDGAHSRFRAVDQFDKTCGAPFIFRAVHPLEFNEGISRITDEMEKAWYPIADREAVKYAAFDALELFHYTAPENSVGVYLMWHCDNEMVTVVITDERFESGSHMIDLELTHSAHIKAIRSRVTSMQLPDNGKKLMFTRRNSKY